MTHTQALQLLAALRDSYFPQGPPTQPELLVAGTIWRAGDLFMRVGSLFAGFPAYLLVVLIYPTGLRATGFKLTRVGCQFKTDWRIGCQGLAAMLKVQAIRRL
jgi:hypothetical protein